MPNFIAHIRTTRGASALLLAVHTCAFSQTNQQPVQQVIIQSGDSDRRARSTTTAIIVGRDAIMRQGDTSLTEVLKRQPAITVEASPGKAPAIRMRGMGAGYVSILLDGLPAPADFSLESISPDLVERIEIQRAATAETSSQAAAGTINVIMRRAGAVNGGGASEIKAGSSLIAGRVAPQMVAQHSARSGTLAYTLTATLRRNENPIEALTTERGTRPSLLRKIAWTDHQVEDVLELAPRLTWQPSALDTITSSAYLRQRFIDNIKHEHESTEIGAPTLFPRAVHTYKTRPLNAYGDLSWTRKLDAAARLTAKLSGFYTTREADFVFLGQNLREELLQQNRVASGPTEREVTFNGSWRRPLWDQHALAAGWEMGRKQRVEYRREQRTSAAGALLRESDEHYSAKVTRGAFFIQDEWDINPAWSAYLGLRREVVHTTGEGNADAPVDRDAGAWSPILQALYKPQRPEGYAGARDQFRLALGRTYKAPSIFQLMPRRYAIDNNNSATNPDQQGNPQLRPELAFSVDLAWERYLGKGSMVSMSAYHKRIRDVTTLRVDESDGVWTATPVNQGNATVRGVEFEGATNFGALALRANLARNWSRIDSVPGPNNGIEGQAPYSGNVGMDYVSPDTRFDLGGTFTFRARLKHRSSATLMSDASIKRQLDLYAVWKRDAKSRLRLSVSDVLARHYGESLVYAADTRLERSTQYRVRSTWRLMWEQRM